MGTADMSYVVLGERIAPCQPAFIARRVRMKERRTVSGAWRWMRFVLIVLVAILLGAAATYLIWGEFTFRDYSTRLFWGGMGAVIVGAIAIWASLGSYSSLGTTNILTAPGDAPIATQRIGEQMRMNAKRYGFTLKMTAVGILCMGISALIEMLTRP
jgi:hypothetical protein